MDDFIGKRRILEQMMSADIYPLNSLILSHQTGASVHTVIGHG